MLGAEGAQHACSACTERYITCAPLHMHVCIQAVDDDSDDDTFSTSTRAALKNRAAAVGPPPALGRGIIPPPKLPTTMRECTIQRRALHTGGPSAHP